MIAAPCPSCQRVTGHKSGPGVAHVLRGGPDGRASGCSSSRSTRSAAWFAGRCPLKVATKARRARYSAAVPPPVMGTLFAGILVARSEVALTLGHSERPKPWDGPLPSEVTGTSSRRRHPRPGTGLGFRGTRRLALPTGGRGSEAAAGRSELHGGAGRAPGGLRDQSRHEMVTLGGGRSTPGSWQY
jgi:hypothetical protein